MSNHPIFFPFSFSLCENRNGRSRRTVFCVPVGVRDSLVGWTVVILTQRTFSFFLLSFLVTHKIGYIRNASLVGLRGGRHIPVLNKKKISMACLTNSVKSPNSPLENASDADIASLFGSSPEQQEHTPLSPRDENFPEIKKNRTTIGEVEITKPQWQIPEPDHFSPYITIKSTNNTKLTTKNIFTLYRELKDKVQVQLKNNVQKNRNGEITIKCQNKEGADSLLRLRTLGDTPVEARVDQQLNSSQGVVKCSHFRDCSEKDMNSISGVIGAYQFSYIDKKKQKKRKIRHMAANIQHNTTTTAHNSIIHHKHYS